MTNPSFTSPIMIRSDNDLQEYPTSDFQTMVQNIMDFTVL